MVARNRMVLSGPLGSPEVDNWSITLHWTLDGGGAVTNQTDLQSWADNAAAVLDGLETNQATLANLLSTVSEVERVDLYAYGDSGPAVAQASASCSGAGLGAIEAPFQVAAVMSLLTGRPGASYRGRAYWPAMGATMGSGGTFSEAAGAATDFAELITELGDIDGTSTAICVVYSPTLDVVTPVTSVRVGNVLDTQRRRRDRVPESFSTVGIIP